MVYLRHLLRSMKLKIIINVIIIKNDVPKILKYCEKCKRYISLDQFEDEHSICNNCRKNKSNHIIKSIIKIVCDENNIGIYDIQLKSNKREIVLPRQEAMYFIKRFTNLSLEKIGNKLGKKDHATVLHGIKQTKNAIDTDKKYKEKIMLLTKKIIKIKA